MHSVTIDNPAIFPNRTPRFRVIAAANCPVLTILSEKREKEQERGAEQPEVVAL